MILYRDTRGSVDRIDLLSLSRNGARLLQVARTRCKSVRARAQPETLYRRNTYYIFETRVWLTDLLACAQTVFAHLMEGYKETIKTVEEAIVLFGQAGEAAKATDAEMWLAQATVLYTCPRPSEGYSIY